MAVALIEITKLKESLESVQGRVKAAAQRVGRKSNEITIVAVTKTVGIDTLKELNNLSWKDIGENRVPEALDKTQSLSGNRFTWHMIGRLQSNKAKGAVQIFDFIHSLDNLHLAEVLQKEAEKIHKFIRVLIQVNVSGELTKGGIKPEELKDFYKTVAAFAGLPSPLEANKSNNSNPKAFGTNQLSGTLLTGQAVTPLGECAKSGGIILSGLMTMAPITNNPETSRPYFRRLKELLDDLKGNFTNNVELKYLSMGMSQDFEIAVEEGANLLRIGSAIFGS